MVGSANSSLLLLQLLLRQLSFSTALVCQASLQLVPELSDKGVLPPSTSYDKISSSVHAYLVFTRISSNYFSTSLSDNYPTGRDILRKDLE